MNPLKQARIYENLSQRELADLLGTSQQNIQLYEQGQKTPPDYVLDYLEVDKSEQDEWINNERDKIADFLNNELNSALSGKSPTYQANLLYFKKQLDKNPPVSSFADLMKIYFTSKAFCSKMLMINYSTLDRHVNGFPVPMKAALSDIGLGVWAAKKEREIYG